MSVDPEAPVRDTPVVPAVAPASTDAIDYEKRYGDLRPQYDRTTQELAAERAIWDDPEKLRERLEAQGYEIESDDDDDLDIGPVDNDVASRLERIEQSMQAQETQQATNARQATWNDWETYVKEQAKEQNLELTARDIKALKLDCVDANGYPVAPAKADAVLKAHIEDVNQWLDAQVQQRSKRPRVPHTPGGGGAAPVPKDVSDMTAEERREYVMAKVRSAESGA